MPNGENTKGENTDRETDRGRAECVRLALDTPGSSRMDGEFGLCKKCRQTLIFILLVSPH